MEILLFLLVLMGLLVLRIPVYICLFLTGVFGIVAFTDIEFVFVAQTIIKKLENFSLLAIPFFIFLGAVMVHGKSAKRLIRVPEKLMSRMPGGLAITSVISSGVFGALSGSSISTVVTIGGVMLPHMDRNGYDKGFSLGLITSSAILGIIIPPSIIMIICALTAGVSVVKLFAAGYLPGLMIIIALCIYAFLKSKKEGMGLRKKSVSEDGKEAGKKFSGKESGNESEKESEEENKDELLKVIWDAILPISLIFILFAGIYSGAFTITEASVVSCVFALIIEAVFFRTLTWKDFYRLIVSSGLISGALVITVSGAGVLSEYITIQGIPERILDFSMQYIPNKVAFLLFTDFLLLLVGTFIDPIGAIMILVPILMPISAQFGIDPLHFCLVITVALGIGYITPPLGLLLYTACAISGKDFTYISRAVMPTTLIYIIMLVVLTFVPWISLVVPGLIDSGM